MPQQSNKYFFTQKKIFLIIAYLIIIFFFAFIALSAMGNQYHSQDLEHIQYCYTAREKVILSEVHLQNANSVKEIKTSPTEYVYLKGTVSNPQARKLLLHSFNGTAKVLVDGKEVFNNISNRKLAGSSYITVPLTKSSPQNSVEILLYSPLSSNFEVEIIPAFATVFSVTNIPYAPIIVMCGLILAFLLALCICLFSKNKPQRGANVLIFVSALLALGAFILEYLPTNNVPHFLFNIKLFLLLLIPIFGLLQISLRFREWNPKLEAFLAINTVYALCIIFLWENVLFFVVLYSSVFLQAVNMLIALNTVIKHSYDNLENYCATEVVFWGLNLWLWIAVAFKTVTWQLMAFIVAVLFYCFVNALSVFRKNREYYLEERERFDVDNVFEEKYENIFDVKDNLNRCTPEYTFSDNCLDALNLFNRKVINRIYYKDNHALKVSEYSRVISSYMGMSRKASDKISCAAVLHDIGKICIPEKTLFKSERLTEDEFQEIKNHIFYGYKLLIGEDDFFKMAALVAKEHHEHIDGSGYMGLKGTQISLPAKIVAVADVFDALVAKRSYKEPWSFDNAFNYIAEHSADYFDKDVVEAFVSAKDTIYEIYSVGNNRAEERD